LVDSLIVGSSMDVTQTLNNFLADTDFGNDPGYLSIDNGKALPARQKHFLEWGKDKISADAVILQQTRISKSCFPLAYFRLLDTADSDKIAEAHRLAWNMGRAPLLFVVLPGKILAYTT